MIKGTQAVKGEFSFLGAQFSDALRSDQVSRVQNFAILVRPTVSFPRALRSYGEKIL